MARPDVERKNMDAVIVTGGSSGLGAAVVDAVLKEGGRPFVLDRRRPAVDGQQGQSDAIADRERAQAVRDVERRVDG